MRILIRNRRKKKILFRKLNLPFNVPKLNYSRKKFKKSTKSHNLFRLTSLSTLLKTKKIHLTKPSSKIRPFSENSNPLTVNFRDLKY